MDLHFFWLIAEFHYSTNAIVWHFALQDHQTGRRFAFWLPVLAGVGVEDCLHARIHEALEFLGKASLQQYGRITAAAGIEIIICVLDEDAHQWLEAAAMKAALPSMNIFQFHLHFLVP